MALTVVVVFVVLACFTAGTLLRLHVAQVLAPVLLGTSLLLYLAGIFNLLDFGFYLVLITAFVGAVFTIYRRGLKGASTTFAGLTSPAFVAFAAYLLVTYLLTRNMQLSSWDEFSHWGTIVKAMYEHNSLSAYNPEDLLFRSYPPAAGLFEYFVMRLGGEWLEGNIFWAYQILVGSLFVPFMSPLRWRSAWKLLLLLPIATLTPVLFSNTFSEIIIDPLLGTVFGYALAIALTSNLFDWRRMSFLALALMSLVLMKDSGAFFACIVLIAGSIRLVRTRRGGDYQRTWLAIIARVGVAAAATAFTSVSWKWLLEIRQIPVAFSAPIDLVALSETLGGGGVPYRQTVLEEFRIALAGRPMSMYFESVNLTWLPWLAILVLLLTVIALISARTTKERFDWPSILVIASGFVAYTGGLAVLYLFRFSEYEALRLASFERYITTYLVGIATLASMSILRLLSEPRDPTRDASLWRRTVYPIAWTAGAFLTFIAFVVPIQALVDFAAAPSAQSQIARAPYKDLVSDARKAGVGQDDRIWLIAQHTVGGQYWIFRYEFMPATTVGDWSIGTPKDAADIWTNTEMTSKKWAQELKDVDFVALYSVTEDFRTQYSDLFSDPAEIEDNALFSVRQVEGRVILVRQD